MPYLNQAKEKMSKAIEHFNHQLNNIRTGRANPNLLDDIMIDYYGTMTPLNQLAQISVVEGTQLLIKPFDPSSLKEMEKAINTSHLNLPVNNDGSSIRLVLPQLTSERRAELVKEVSKLAEEAKVLVRNARRDVNDAIKKADELTEDMQKDMLEKVQKATDEHSKKIEEISKDKAVEIKTI